LRGLEHSVSADLEVVKKYFLKNTSAIEESLLTLFLVSEKRVVSSVGRAPALQAGCHQFESGTTH
jgi:hypothetical protein